jgi:hypothetical protein
MKLLESFQHTQIVIRIKLMLFGSCLQYFSKQKVLVNHPVVDFLADIESKSYRLAGQLKCSFKCVNLGVF